MSDLTVSGPILELQGVGRRFPMGSGEVVALAGVDLRVERGELVALAGPSGSGKTTLLNLVGCLDRASEGSLKLDGVALEGLDERGLVRLRAEKVGFVFQSFNLIPVLSAIENVEVALRLSGQPLDRGRCAEALDQVGLEGLHGRRPSQLSGGQQQRVAVARALVKRPALVIADEPTANLDSKTGDAVLALMRRLNQEQGITFLMSSHDPLVLDHAQRVVWLRDGRVVTP